MANRDPAQRPTGRMYEPRAVERSDWYRGQAQRRPTVVERILRHLGLPAVPVRANPAQPPSADLVAD